MRRHSFVCLCAVALGGSASQVSSRGDGQFFAVATSGLGQLYLSHERCPVSWMTGRAKLVQGTGVVWEMCWRTDKTNPRLLNVCNVSLKLTRKGEVGACMPASKSMFVRLDSLPQRAF